MKCKTIKDANSLKLGDKIVINAANGQQYKAEIVEGWCDRCPCRCKAVSRYKKYNRLNCMKDCTHTRYRICNSRNRRKVDKYIERKLKENNNGE